MAEESWHEARLIPTSGINGAEEQERRATSALLAVLVAVKEFGRGFVKPFGAPAGTLESFIEVPFILGEKRLYPDGLIRVTRGAKSWTALVEVKTGPNQLATEQLENYLDIAREQGFDAVLTISNEIPAVAGQHPTKVDKRKLRKVALHHVSWSQVLAEAVMQKEFRGVADPDQAWILGELIRYLEHRKSGALEFDDMGESWVGVRDQVAAGTLRATDKGIAEVVARFDALLRFASLQLGRQLGTEVVPVLSRKEAADPAVRAQALTHVAVPDRRSSPAPSASPTPSATSSSPPTCAPRKVTCHVDVDAPREGRPTTRVNWLVRQLKNAPDGTARRGVRRARPRLGTRPSCSRRSGRTRPASSSTRPRSCAPSGSPPPARWAPSAAAAAARSSTPSSPASTASTATSSGRCERGPPRRRSCARRTPSRPRSTTPCRPRWSRPTTPPRTAAEPAEDPRPTPSGRGRAGARRADPEGPHPLPSAADVSVSHGMTRTR